MIAMLKSFRNHLYGFAFLMAGLLVTANSHTIALGAGHGRLALPRQSGPIQIAAQSFTLVGGPSNSSLWYIVDDGGTSNGLPDSSADCQNVPPDYFGVMIDNAEFSGGPGRAFDQAGVWLNDRVFTSTTVITSVNSLTAGPMTVTPTISATLQYYAASETATLRTLISLQNTGPVIQVVTATLAVNFGSDSDTVYVATSDGNSIATENDRWIVSSDSIMTSTNAVNTTVLTGPFGPSVTPSAVVDSVFACPGAQTAGILAEYPVAVPSGATRRLMFFNQINPTNAAALAATGMFTQGMATLADDLTAGIDPGDWDEVVNWPMEVWTVYLPLIRR